APYFPGMDFDVLVTALDRYRSIDAWTPTPMISREGFARLQEVMMLAGELSQPVPFDEVMTNAFAERVVAQGATP
ncbi:MAG TPA: hypothetical protein VIK93_03350, partial [Limnochordales bacterium]